MRLLDRMLSQGFGVNPKHAGSLADYLLTVLKDAQLVVVDNVAKYYFSNKISDNVLKVSDFPCVMTPFEHTFMEFKMPHEYKQQTNMEEVGMLMFVTDDIEKYLENFPEIMNQEGVKYCLVSDIFIRQIGWANASLVVTSVLPIGVDGQIISPNKDFIYGYNTLLVDGFDSESEKNYLQGMYLNAFFPVLLGLSFMHCRNVKTEEKGPVRQQSRAHKRKTGRPLLRYHVLVIDHMKEVLEREGHVSKKGLKKALHICRGHFATYGMDGKGLLFGKHKGRIWVPMHTRGSAEQGIVVKDYDVK